MKSDNCRTGMQQAPHRSLFNALGFTEEEMKKPMVGIVSSYNEIVPGHMNLDKIVNAVKQVLKDGYRTIDIMSDGCIRVGCSQMGTLLTERI